MKLVFLEKSSVGIDIDDSCFDEFGEVVRWPVMDIGKTAERVKDADIILANKTPLNENTLKDAHHVHLIAELATGFDNIDLEYCKRHHIAVCNVPDYASNAVAQHTFALALCLLSKLAYYDRYVKNKDWSKQQSFSCFQEPITELAGKTWGILGMGTIGRQVKRIAEAFGCHVINAPVSGRKPNPNEVSFETLLKKSDIISLHCPLTEKTYHLIDQKAFSYMKSTAVLINTARGKCVESNALFAALTEGKIQAAGLDVTEKEPLPIDDPLLSIKDSSKLIITPHMAWASIEARTRDIKISYENIKAFLSGEKMNRII